MLVCLYSVFNLWEIFYLGLLLIIMKTVLIKIPSSLAILIHMQKNLFDIICPMLYAIAMGHNIIKNMIRL